MMITLFLCGDVMLGRGIDQIMPRSVDPVLHESYVRNARRYVALAEERHGHIPDNVEPTYVWGDALDVLRTIQPQVRIINLETAVTTIDDYDRHKGIHYRMHPANIGVMKAAGIDVCTLANNHVLDWGQAGLSETLETLTGSDLAVAGAGTNDDEAEAPAIVDLGDRGRVLVFAFAMPDSGVPRDWSARPEEPGVNVLPNLSDQSVERIAGLVNDKVRDRDVVIVSIHWGGNWGYEIPQTQQRFAHQLIDEAGVDVVYGHSSHHVKGIEIYEGRPIFYGCGDFLNDYEGIGGHESYRPDLALMYFPTIDPDTGRLAELRMRPMQIRNFRLKSAGDEDLAWLRDMLDRESNAFGVRFTIDSESGDLIAHWE